MPRKSSPLLLFHVLTATSLEKHHVNLGKCPILSLLDVRDRLYKIWGRQSNFWASLETRICRIPGSRLDWRQSERLMGPNTTDPQPPHLHKTLKMFSSHLQFMLETCSHSNIRPHAGATLSVGGSGPDWHASGGSDQSPWRASCLTLGSKGRHQRLQMSTELGMLAATEVLWLIMN